MVLRLLNRHGLAPPVSGHLPWTFQDNESSHCSLSPQEQTNLTSLHSNYSFFKRIYVPLFAFYGLPSSQCFQ